MFATVALGMGVNMVGVNATWHYWAPASLEDYSQKSSRDGRTGKQAKVGCTGNLHVATAAHLRRDHSTPSDVDVAAVRQLLRKHLYLNVRIQLVHHLDPDLARTRGGDEDLAFNV